MKKHGYLENKKAYLVQLRRIEGQVRGIQRMLEEEQYCIDILTQNSAVQNNLKSVSMKILDDHVKHCVKDAIAAGPESQEANEKLDEALKAVHRMTKNN